MESPSYGGGNELAEKLSSFSARLANLNVVGTRFTSAIAQLNGAYDDLAKSATTSSVILPVPADPACVPFTLPGEISGPRSTQCNRDCMKPIASCSIPGMAGASLATAGETIWTRSVTGSTDSLNEFTENDPLLPGREFCQELSRRLGKQECQLQELLFLLQDPRPNRMCATSKSLPQQDERSIRSESKTVDSTPRTALTVLDQERVEPIEWSCSTEPTSLVELGGKRERKGSATLRRATVFIAKLERDRIFLRRVVEHPAYEGVIACVIMVHALCIGINVEYLASYGENIPLVLHVFNLLLALLFVIEVLMKAFAEDKDFCVGHERVWNIFDICLVSILVFEASIGLLIDWGIFNAEQKKQVLIMVKFGELARVGRVLHIFRFLRFSSTLQVILVKMGHSVKPLFWIAILMCMLLYLIAVCITQGVLHFLDGIHHRSPESMTDGQMELQQLFGNVARSVQTLFASISGGLLWNKVFDALHELGALYSYIFIAYVAFSFFGLLNIISGIFMDACAQSAMQERELITDQERARAANYAQTLRRIFGELDADGSGIIDWEEFKAVVADERVRDFLKALQIDTSDTEQLFNMLDSDKSGEIEIDEFVDGCMKYKGAATSYDVHAVLFENKRIQRSLGQIDSKLETYLNRTRHVMPNSPVQRTTT